MAEGVCSLTGRRGTFVKSHLYPKSFYPKGEPGEPLALLNTNPESPYQKSWVGVYDSELCTAYGEEILGRIDQKGYNILQPWEDIETLKSRAIQAHYVQNEIVAVELDQRCSGDLLLFFYSLLWRFHSSKRPEASNVDIGSHAASIRDAILAENADLLKSAEVFLSKITGAITELVILPARFRQDDGVITYEFVFGGFRAWVKCDSRDFPKDIQSFTIRSDSRVLVLLHDSAQSKSFKSIVRATKKKTAIHGDPWKGRYKEKYGY